MDYLTRAQWGAQYDANLRPAITLPVTDLFVHHNVIAPTSSPAHDMLVTEQADIARFGYPSYSWGIHPSGVVLEGMVGRLSAHTLGHNATGQAIMFMGNFENDTPTGAAMQAGRELIVKAQSDGVVTGPINLRGHRDVYATACPGANLYPRIAELLLPPLPPPTTLLTPTQEWKMNTVVLPSGRIVVTIIGTDSGIYTTHSDDGGEHWSTYVRIGTAANQVRNPI